MQIVLLQAIAVASAGLFSFGSILLVLLMLGSENGLRKGIAYVSGYIGGYFLVGALFLAIGSQWSSTSSAQGGIPFGAIIQIVLGLLFLYFGIKRWMYPPENKSDPPKFMTTIDKMKPLKVLGFGAMVTVINFKNLAIFLSAVSVIVGAHLPWAQAFSTLLIVVFVFCASVMFPLLLYICFSKKIMPFLQKMKLGLETHSYPLSIFVFCLFGSLFVGKGIMGLF